MINIKLETAKRAAEIIQEKQQVFNYLNLNAAINQAAREFKKGDNKSENIEGIVRGIVC